MQNMKSFPQEREWNVMFEKSVLQEKQHVTSRSDATSNVTSKRFYALSLSACLPSSVHMARKRKHCCINSPYFVTFARERKQESERAEAPNDTRMHWHRQDRARFIQNTWL